MHRTVEIKLYPTPAQEETLGQWLRCACWTYNRALEQRIKSYKRRGKTATLYDQQRLLTNWRERMESLRSVPAEALRDALRRVDRGMQAFFRRCKAGENPGFPRFRSQHRYNSLEFLAPGSYVRAGDYIHVPKLGLVKFRGGNQNIPGKQRLLRIVRRASGWYSQILIDDGQTLPEARPIQSSVGVDVGLASFVTLSTGEKIGNPRWERSSQRQLVRAQRRVSRGERGSKNRRKAIKRLQCVHEKIAARRKDFCHKLSRRLVNEFDLIAVENLNIKGMARTRMARSVMDAGWMILLNQLAYKAASAGKQAIQVDPRGTSQECPDCGVVRRKDLGQRTHNCDCGLVIDRDHAAARVILDRALGVAGVLPVEDGTAAGNHHGSRQVPPEKQEVIRRPQRSNYGTARNGH